MSAAAPPAPALTAIAESVIENARRLGAELAECTIIDSEEFECRVRLGEVEKLTRAGSRAIGLRVITGQRVGSAYTSDFTQAGLQRMLDSAVSLAKISTVDEYAGLPEPSELGSHDADLQLYWDDVAALDPQHSIDMARRAEAAAIKADPRIVNSEGGSFASNLRQRVFANSLGFSGCYRSSSCSISAVPVVEDNGVRQRDYWFSAAPNVAGLDEPESVGLRAAERVLRRIGARKVATAKVPVVFEQRVARSIAGHIFEAVAGETVYRKESFLAGKLGEKVASSNVTLIDDAILPAHLGSSPFDDEGVRSRRTVVVENGVLRSYLLNSYAARKLSLRTTGNAVRGITGNASTGTGNLYLAPGELAPAQIVSKLKNAFYVTELLGSGVNITNGDYSRGAAGLWIENGELAYPVQEVTVAGDLRRMLQEIDTVGSDLEFRGSVAAPTLLVGEMTISGR